MLQRKLVEIIEKFFQAKINGSILVSSDLETTLNKVILFKDQTTLELILKEVEQLKHNAARCSKGLLHMVSVIILYFLGDKTKMKDMIIIQHRKGALAVCVNSWSCTKL